MGLASGMCSVLWRQSIDISYQNLVADISQTKQNIDCPLVLHSKKNNIQQIWNNEKQVHCFVYAVNTEANIFSLMNVMWCSHPPQWMQTRDEKTPFIHQKAHVEVALPE